MRCWQPEVYSSDTSVGLQEAREKTEGRREGPRSGSYLLEVEDCPVADAWDLIFNKYIVLEGRFLIHNYTTD